MIAGRRPRGVLAAALILALAGCARLTGTPVASPTDSAGPPPPTASVAPSTATDPSPSGAPDESAGAAIDVDLAAIREALVGPSPVPEGWEEQVDEIMTILEQGLADIRLPAVAALPADEAACETWQPLVGRQLWAIGALLERQVFIAHLAQLANVAPDEIRADAEEALLVSAAAAAEQLTPDGDPEVVSRIPREELRALGLWAVEQCELPIEADAAPDTEDWTEEDIAYSCDLDRSSLERGMEEFREAHGRYATHPHELEVSLEISIYPAWHRIASVDNEASPPTFSVEPIPGAFCDR